jgi:CRISPR type IV-associated protein Csf3
MTPLAVTFRLGSAMRQPENPIHLDALLAWAVVDEATEAGHPDPWSVQHEIPIARHGEGDRWVFCASMLCPPAALPLPFVAHRTRAQHGTLLARAVASGVISKGPNIIPAGSGRFKLYLLSDTYQWVSHLSAWCLSTNPDRVRELLQRVHHIGKGRGLDAGRVTSVDVVESPDANDRWRHRVMPDPAPGYLPIHATMRPPYWARELRVEAYFPAGDRHAERA